MNFFNDGLTIVSLQLFCFHSAHKSNYFHGLTWYLWSPLVKFDESFPKIYYMFFFSKFNHWWLKIFNHHPTIKLIGMVIKTHFRSPYVKQLKHFFNHPPIYCFLTHNQNHLRLPHTECRNPTLEEWEDDSLTLKIGTWESIGTPKTSKFNFRDQNTLHWSVLYIIEKLSKCRCRKWAYMSHLNIFCTSYDKKKG